MKQIYLMRHGYTTLHGKYVGKTDCSLSARGIENLQKTKKYLSAIDFVQIVSSPLKRCLETIQIVKPHNDYKIAEHAKEMGFGEWEGHSFEEVCSFDQSIVDKWIDSPMTFCFPGGEAVPDFINRIELFYESLMSELPDGKTLIVCHGGVIRFLICLFLKIPMEKYMSFDPEPGKIALINVFDDQNVLAAMNISGD